MEGREILVDTRRLTDAQGRVREYSYFVLVGEMDVGNFSCEAYGVMIRETGGESAALPGLTVSAARIDELAGLRVRGGVTPVTLRDVVDDWL